MAANSETIAIIARHPNFNLRCQLIATQFSLNAVAIENGATTNHTNRLAFASMVIKGDVSPEVLARAVLIDANIYAAALADADNIAAAVADSGIDAQLQAVWNALANAYAA
jgi:hypothetical protein